MQNLNKKLDTPRVFIIILNWNGLADTIECIESLAQITYYNYKIVIVDNGSANKEAEKLKSKYSNLKVIALDHNTGYTGGCNTGIKYAIKNKADYVLLLNNDTVVSENFLNILIGTMEKEKALGITSPKILYYKSNKVWSMGGLTHIFLGMTSMIGKGKVSKHYEETLQPEFVSGCAMLIKKEVIKSVGLLNNAYFAYYEDVDFSYRVKKEDYFLKIIPSSIVWHKKSASAGTAGSNKLSNLQAYLYGRNSIIFAKLNLNGWQFLFFILGKLTFNLLYIAYSSKNFHTFWKHLEGIKEGIKYNVT